MLTSRDYLERYGLPVAALAIFALVVILLPGNQDGAQVSTAPGAPGAPITAPGAAPVAPGGSGGASAPSPIAPGGGASAPVVTSGSSGAGGSGGFGSAPSSSGGSTGAAGSSGSGATGGSTGGGDSGSATPTTAAPAAGGGGVPTPVFGQGPNCNANGRQIGISGYMPPCVEWPVGADNGGATYRGVTANTIKIAIWQGQEDPATRSALAGARLNDEPPVVARMYEALRRYSNAHYETYGREVIFEEIVASGASTNDEAMKADAVRIADEMGAFAAFTGNALAGIPTVLGRELAQRGVICICTTSLSSAFYQELPPLIWSALPTMDEYAAQGAEYAAKKMGFEPAQYGGLGTQGVPRVYCLMYLTGTGERVDPEGTRIGQVVKDAFAARGIAFKTVIAYLYDPGSNQNDVTAMVTKFKSEGCTTLVPIVDPIMPILITREATNQQYFPEWFIVGTGLSDTTTIGRFYDQAQWGNAFGISPLWVTWDDVKQSAGYHEWHHMEDGNDGDEGALINVYRSAFQTLWTGIHMAGPNLTPATFEQGMYNYPPTGGTPANPLVFLSREFPTQIKDFSEVWWDPNRVGPDERTDIGPGMIVRAEGGARYRPGEWPVGPPSRNNPATTTAEQGNDIDHYTDGHTHDTPCLSCTG